MKHLNNSKSSEPMSVEGYNFRDGSKRNSFPNFRRSFRNTRRKQICQPMPVKGRSLGKSAQGDSAPQGCNIKSRLNRKIKYNENDDLQEENFVQELEDRVEADLEIENIFLNLSHEGISTIAKSLPERPGNPIVNDQIFRQENPEQIDQNGKLFRLNLEKITSLSQRECSIERQKRIFQEDMEAQNEINELFHSSSAERDLNPPTFYSLSCSSEVSSLEVEVSKPFLREISLEN